MLCSHGGQKVAHSHGGQKVVPSHGGQKVVHSHGGQKVVPSHGGQKVVTCTWRPVTVGMRSSGRPAAQTAHSATVHFVVVVITTVIIVTVRTMQSTKERAGEHRRSGNYLHTFTS